LYHFFKLVTFIFCIAANSLLCQDLKKVDSLKQKLVNAKDGDRFTLLNELFKENNSSNFSLALDYANDFDNLAVSKGDSAKIVQGGRMRAYSLMDLGRNEEAITVLTRILGIAKRNQGNKDFKKQIKFILNNIGLAYTYLGNYDVALDFHYQSLELREGEGDKAAIRTSYNNIGLVHFNLKDYERAIQYYEKAIELSKEINVMSGAERIYINLGLCYLGLEKYNDAIKSFDNGFKICGNDCSENIIKEGLEGLGIAYFRTRQTTLAKENFLRSLAISKRQNDKRCTCENLFNLGLIEVELKHEAQGISYIKQAELIAESNNLAEAKLMIYKELTTYYGKKKDLEKSLNYQIKYSQFKDSIYSQKLINNLAKVQTNFDQRENLKTIAERNQLVALQKEVIIRQQRQNVFIIVITCLIVSLALVLYFFIRQQQKANYKISQAKLMIEEQNAQLASYNKQLEERVAARTKDLILANKALLQVNAELDNFIYKTSHDIRGPLATLKGMCNVALMDIKDEMAIGYLRKLDSTADRMNTILTRLMIVNHIHSSVLVPVQIDFKEVLDQIFSFEHKKGMPDRFSLTYEIETPCSIISDLALVKIILENLVDNAIKFYNSSARVDPFAKVNISNEGQHVKATVEDNGIGIESKEGKEVFKMFMRASERSEIGGIGLYLTKLATEKIGGEVQLVRSDSKGSLFEVIFPVDLTVVIKSRIRSEQNLVELIQHQSEPISKPSATVI
jgi:signal transduction histidine kinase/tetratricopeptide (TPR) repeat protein